MINTNKEQKFKYFAFISYSSHDTAWGRRLQKKLEGYSLPTTLCSERGWERKPMRPVFFAPTDIQPGGLDDELKNRLRASKNLIVVCSPHSAQSEWVGKEIEYFHSLGRQNNIHFFIVEGRPHSGDEATECFNPVVDELKIPEILGANIHENIYRWPWLNRERAYVQLITKLLGIEFDAIWQRHKRRLKAKIAAWTLGTVVFIAALCLAWQSNQPVNIEFALNELSEHNSKLPPLKDAVITLTVDNETKTDTISSLRDKGVFVNIPHRFMGKDAHISLRCKDFLNVDTVMTLQKSMTIPVRRDVSVYGNINFRLWNPYTEKTVSNCQVEIQGQKTVSDSEGRVLLFVPLSLQQPVYRVSAAVPLEDSLLYMPCGADDVILTKNNN